MILKVWGDWTLFQELLAVLRSIGDRHGGVSIANVATRWVLDQPAVGAVIIGECEISSPLHLPSFTPHYLSSQYLPPFHPSRFYFFCPLLRLCASLSPNPSAYQRGLTDLTWTALPFNGGRWSIFGFI